MPFVKIEGLDELERAVERSPEKTRTELNRFFVRGLAVYRSGIKNNPWRIGMQGGGSPVARVNGGNLRDSHTDKIQAYRASIGPTASYASYVHGLNGQQFSKRGLQLRPWLDSVRDEKQQEIDKLSLEMLDNIIKDLAK